MSEQQKGNNSEYPWEKLTGLSETEAEKYMLENWGLIPDDWLSPIFRGEVLGSVGAVELEAHMNTGRQAYEESLGERTEGIWYSRNIGGQGHPANKDWLKRRKT